MRYKEKIKKMELLDLLIESSKKGSNTTLSTVLLLLLCCGFWLTRQYPILSMVLLLVSFVPMIFTCVEMIRFETVNNEIDHRVKEYEDSNE